jgi:hypothetical protein
MEADPVALNTDVEHRLGVIARKQAAGFSAKRGGLLWEGYGRAA